MAESGEPHLHGTWVVVAGIGQEIDMQPLG